MSNCTAQRNRTQVNPSSRELWRRHMKNKLFSLMFLFSLALCTHHVYAATDWSTQDYDLYAGDFNGDGKTDMLYVAKDFTKLSGIVLSDGTSLTIGLQSWLGNYLGLPWFGNQYNIIVADFNGDGRADIFMQSVAPGDNYLLFSDASGKINAISQVVGNNALGLIWSADQHKLIAGNFNSDHKADLFLQATSVSGIDAILYPDSNGTFTVAPTQTWSDGYLGLNWSTPQANVYAADFNGDGKADLLVQAKASFIQIALDDITFPVPTYPPNMNGVAISQGGTSPFQLTNLQTWSRTDKGVDWSPSSNTIVVGDFSGDGIADVVLQANSAGQTSYFLKGNASGSAFSAPPSILSSSIALTGDSARLIVGNFAGTPAAGLFVQTTSAAGTNSIANTVNTTGGTTSVSTYDNKVIPVPQQEAAYLSATRYNVAGQVTGTIAPDPDGNGPLRLLATRNTYDSTGLLIKVEQGQLVNWPDDTVDVSAWANYGFSGNNIFSTTMISYDSYGRKTQELGIGRDGITAESETEFSYDTAGKVLCKAVRMNKPSFGSTYVDACLQRSGDSALPDRIYQYTYDGFDHVLTEQRGVGTALQETYVTNTYSSQLLTSQTDANGNLTYLTYDNYGRLLIRYYPSRTTPGKIDQTNFNYYLYDANGNLTYEIKRDWGKSVTYTYDANNRLITKDLNDNTYSPDVYYDYDARGRTLQAAYGSDGGAGIYTSYDGFGRVIASTNTMGGTSRTLSYQYDDNGNRTRITHPDGTYFQYAFDGLNRLNRLCESATSCPDGSSALLVSVGYKPEGIPSYISRNNNASVTSIPAQVGTPSQFGLNNGNRVQNLVHDFQGTADDLTNTFTYNAGGQIVQLDQSNTAYSYVGNNNITGDYWVNGLNQYFSVNGQTFQYDLNGNETNDGTTAYAYDMENHLVGASGTGVSASFQYDPQGRLFQSTINGTTTQFLYDNNALVAEYVAGTMTKRYVHGDQVDQPLVQYTGSTVTPAARQYLHADHQGSIIAQSDNSGTVQAKYTYDNFGNPGNITTADRFGYTGQLWFKDIKLNYYKARWYSSYQGRFLQTDPIFYKDDMDLYTYVGNDPMDRKDPTGLCAEDLCIGEAEAAAQLGNAAFTAVTGIAAGYVTYEVATAFSNGVQNAAMNASSSNNNSSSSSQNSNNSGNANKNNNGNGNGNDPKKSPPPNNGDARPHGGPEHDARINQEIQKAKSQGAENIRKNQVQTDANGNRVGNNRPDLQFDQNGKHTNVEVDNNAVNSEAHGQTIRQNDPQANCVLIKLNGGC